ncbi:MAG TPA: murein biosynthesis integral membrane protein MurJ [Actinomycetota bacterium]|nr:murein biosynthesis integral membrane protein MurJ [Actinomycetota bacterium]
MDERDEAAATAPAHRRDPAEQVSQPSLGRASALMSAGTALSRVTGFARLSVMAWAIGGTESKLPDTFNLSNSLPNIVHQLVIGEVLATLFVPVFVEHLRKRDREEAWGLASTVMNLAVTVSTIFTVVTVIAAPWIIKIYSFRVPDADRAAFEATGTFFLRLFMPQMIFYAMGLVLTGLLDAHRRFAAPRFAPLLNNVIVIATFAAFKMVHSGSLHPASLTTGEKLLLAGGTTFGVVAMTLVLWPYVRSLPGSGYRIRAFQWKHPAIRHVGKLAKYSFGYVIVNQVGLWVVYALANGERGGVTAYQSAWILYQLPYGIFAVSVMTYLVPRLAEHHVDGNVDALRNDVSLGLRTTSFIVLPAAAGFIALGQPLIRLLLEHGVFSSESTELFADTFVLMAVGLGAYAAFQMVMRAFYAMQDTKTPLLVNVAAVGANVVTAVPLFAVLGVPGLALSHAISYATGMVVGASILRRRIGGLDGARLLAAHARIGIAAAATGGVAWGVARALADAVDLDTFVGQLTQVLAAVAAGALTYFVVARVLGVRELGSLMDMLFRRLRRRRAASSESGGIVLGYLVKLAIAFALIGAVLFETAAVVVAKFSVDGTAVTAASEAGLSFGRHGSTTKARDVAEDVAERNGARLVDFRVNEDDERIVVTLEKDARTWLAHRIGALEKFARARATQQGRIR